MALKTEFERRLNGLFRRRAAWLKSAVGRKAPGPVPAFDAKVAKQETRKLVEIAKELVLKQRGQSEFDGVVDEVRRWHPKKGKGHGVPAKKHAFNDWYPKSVSSPNCIYVFWSGNRCLYVGRTIKGKGRPQSHFEKFWFGKATQIDIFTVHSPSEVPKAECLAMDLYRPKYTKYKASRRRYAKKCPVCSVLKEMEKDLKAIFRLR